MKNFSYATKLSRYVSSQKPKAINPAENIGPDSNCKNFKSIFDESFPNEFNKGMITEIFDILQVHERNDLVKEFENVLKYAKAKVWTNSLFVFLTLLSPML